MAVVWAAAIAGLAALLRPATSSRPQSGTEKIEAVDAAATKASGDPFGGLSADQIAGKAVAADQVRAVQRIAGRVTGDGELLTVDFAVDSNGFLHRQDRDEGRQRRASPGRQGHVHQGRREVLDGFGRCAGRRASPTC